MNIMHKNEIFLNKLFTFGKRCINIEKDILGAKKIEDKQVNNDFFY